MDLCSGCGIMPFRFYDSGVRGRIVALEIQPDAVQLIKRAVAQQNITNIEPVCRDLKGYKSEKLFDVISCNPPYFTSGQKAQNDSRSTIRHEREGLLSDVVATAAANLKHGGRFCMCHRPQRIADIFCIMRAHGIEPKRLRFVRPKSGRAPFLALIDGRKGGGVGLHLLPDLVVETRGGNHTAELMRIYKSHSHSQSKGENG